jgi:hypothetical protein
MRGQGLAIEASVATLMKTLADNRDQHFRDYEKAKKGWRKLLAKQLTGLLADLEAGKSIEGSRLHLEAKPTHYLKEYDEALDMLKYATNTVIELNQEQFRAYVNDEWSWKTHWEASNSSYLAAGM